MFVCPSVFALYTELVMSDYESNYLESNSEEIILPSHDEQQQNTSNNLR